MHVWCRMVFRMDHMTKMKHVIGPFQTALVDPSSLSSYMSRPSGHISSREKYCVLVLYLDGHCQCGKISKYISSFRFVFFSNFYII